MKLCTGQRLRCRHLWRAMKQFLHPFSTVLIKTKGIAYCILPQMAERGDNVAHMSNWGASLDLELCQVAFAEIDFKTAFKTIKIPLPTVHTKLAFLTAEIFFAEDLLIDFNYILFTERVENINPFLRFFYGCLPFITWALPHLRKIKDYCVNANMNNMTCAVRNYSVLKFKSRFWVISDNFYLANCYFIERYIYLYCQDANICKNAIKRS